MYICVFTCIDRVRPFVYPREFVSSACVGVCVCTVCTCVRGRSCVFNLQRL